MPVGDSEAVTYVLQNWVAAHVGIDGVAGLIETHRNRFGERVTERRRICRDWADG
jgi:hypothetical protein